jgi:hypothetical protein
MQPAGGASALQQRKHNDKNNRSVRIQTGKRSSGREKARKGWVRLCGQIGNNKQ